MPWDEPDFTKHTPPRRAEPTLLHAAFTLAYPANTSQPKTGVTVL